MAGKWKPGDIVRLKNTVSPEMNVGGTNAKDPDKVDCDWIDGKGNPKSKTHHEDQLEAVTPGGSDPLPITMG